MITKYIYLILLCLGIHILQSKEIISPALALPVVGLITATHLINQTKQDSLLSVPLSKRLNLPPISITPAVVGSFLVCASAGLTRYLSPKFNIWSTLGAISLIDTGHYIYKKYKKSEKPTILYDICLKTGTLWAPYVAASYISEDPKMLKYVAYGAVHTPAIVGKTVWHIIKDQFTAHY